jgi:invasion protein IalB
VLGGRAHDINAGDRRGGVRSSTFDRTTEGAPQSTIGEKCAPATGRCTKDRCDAQPPAAEAQAPQLIYSPWTKVCLKGQEANARQACFTAKDGRAESGMLVVAAVVIEPEGETKKLLRVTLPLGMQLPPGTRVIVDQDPPINAPYVICFTNGCMADYKATSDLISKMKKGQGLAVQGMNSRGQVVTLVLPLNDFGQAYDGPPTDPKVFEEQQKKLQDELLKRAEEAREKLEGLRPSLR